MHRHAKENSQVASAAPSDESQRNFDDASREWRRLFAELWGTFLLVLVTTAVAIMKTKAPGEVTTAMAAAASGLTVMVIIYSLGAVSGAHINPAVTFAFALRRNFPWCRVPGYLAAQLIGACAAVWFLRIVLGADGDLGATIPKHGVDLMHAAVLETLLTAALVNAILATASGARNVGANAGIAIGGYIVLAGLWAEPLTGASMNPARSLGPDLLRWDFSTTWPYIIGPFLGSTIGVGFEWILKGPPTRSGTEAAQGNTK